MKGALNFDFLKPGSNSIGFLRLVLASLVVLSHSFAIGGVPAFGHMYALIAVSGFFFLSGMLITQSFEHSASWWDYLWRRTLRIFPGYWGCILFSAFVITPIAMGLQHKPFPLPAAFSYVLHGLPMVGRESTIGNVFDPNPIPYFMNGSLWTLPLEYACYIVVGLFGVVGALRNRWIMAGVALVLYIWHVFPQTRLPELPHAPGAFANSNVLEPYLMFALGSVAHLFRARIKPPLWLGPLGLAFLLFLFAYESPSEAFQLVSRILRVFALPFALVWLATALPFRGFDRKRDLSYGTYIYAYPIQQTLVVAGVSGGWPLFFTSYPLTLLLALLSWTAVEGRAMKYKKLFAKPRPPTVDPR